MRGGDKGVYENTLRGVDLSICSDDKERVRRGRISLADALFYVLKSEIKLPSDKPSDLFRHQYRLSRSM